MIMRFQLMGISKLALVAALAAGAGACSSDTLRFAEGPFGSARVPEPVATGALPPTQALPAPILSAPISPVQAQPLAAPVISQSLPAPTVQSPVAATGSASATRAVSGLVGSASGWSATGGTPITVSHGDTIGTLSNRYGIPASALAAVNGLRTDRQGLLAAGSTLIIPVYDPSQSAAVSSGLRPQGSRVPSMTAPARNATQIPLARDESPAKPTGFKAESAIKNRDSKAVSTRISTSGAESTKPPGLAVIPSAPPIRTVHASQAPAGAPLSDIRPQIEKVMAKKIAQEKLVQGESAQEKSTVAKQTAAKPVQGFVSVEAPNKQETTRPIAVKQETTSVTKAELVKEAVKEPVRENSKLDTDKTASVPSTASTGGADFRWPAKGRIISGFGGAGANEGINIAVPEGTPVKAAENGTVAYSGSELKGYGNLVLIRHDNGYVSAYANNSELLVRRGERIKRGQTIAKSGQSGNVNAPQLHFEIRKGATPVDPMPYLTGG
jgi:murein DD-endopeptidase MepM/ murein hydrolase activator NlpD